MKRLLLFIISVVFSILIPGTRVSAESYPEATYTNNVALGNGTYVVVNTKGEIKTSLDFEKWTEPMSIFSFNWPSKDLLEFAEHTVSESGQLITINDIIWANNRFIAVGGSSPAHLFTGSKVIISSIDARNWDVILYENDSNCILNSVTYGDKGFVAVGQGGNILTSLSGEKWDKVESNIKQSLNTVAYINDKYLLYDELGDVYTSHNVLQWEKLINPNEMDDSKNRVPFIWVIIFLSLLVFVLIAILFSKAKAHKVRQQ